MKRSLKPSPRSQTSSWLASASSRLEWEMKIVAMSARVPLLGSRPWFSTFFRHSVQTLSIHAAVAALKGHPAKRVTVLAILYAAAKSPPQMSRCFYRKVGKIRALRTSVTDG